MTPKTANSRRTRSRGKRLSKNSREGYPAITSWVRPQSLDKLSQETVEELRSLSFARVKQIISAQLNRIRLEPTLDGGDQKALLKSIRILNDKASAGDEYEIDFKRRTLVKILNSPRPNKNHEAVILPMSVTHSFSGVVKFFERQRKRKKDLTYDLNRLYNVNRFSPDAVKLGKDDFREYVVFSFEKAQVAILECPIVGNAMYVLEGNWRSLLRLSKSALVKRREEVRIIHNRELLPEVQSLIKTRILQANL